MKRMKGKTRMLAAAITAVMALGAVGAQGAMAEPLFRSDESHTIVSGAQEGTHVVEFGEGNQFTCSTVTFSGTMNAAESEELTITPNFSGCVAFGFANSHVNFTGCDYKLTTTEGLRHLACPEEAQVDITPTIFGFSICTITVLPGTHSSVAYDNASGGDIQLTLALTGISYEEHGSGCGVGSGNDATYTGNTTLEGTDTDEEPVDIEVG